MAALSSTCPDLLERCIPCGKTRFAPGLREIVTGDVTITRNIKTMGMSEGAIDEIVGEFFGLENPYLGIYSKADGNPPQSHRQGS